MYFSKIGNVSSLTEKMTTCLEDVETVKMPGGNIVHFTVPRFKQRLTVVSPDFNNIQSVLDVCKVKLECYETQEFLCFDAGL